MDERELAARMAGAADLVDDVAGVAFELPHDHVHDVGDEDVFLLRIGREIDRACRAAHQRVASDEELLEVLAVLGEDLHAISRAVADVDESILGNAHAVHGRFEILRRRLALAPDRRLAIIADLGQRLAVSAPTALELAGVPVIDHDPQGRGGIELGRRNAAQQKIRLLIVLLLLIGRNRRASMAEFGDELAVLGEFQDRVAGLRPCDVHVVLLVDKDRMLRFRPARHHVGLAPGTQQISLPIEFEHRRRRNAAFGGGRIERRVIVRLVEVTRTVQHPEVIVLIDEHAGDAAEGPIVGERFRPGGIIFVLRRAFSSRGGTHSHGCDSANPKYRGQ